MDRRAKEFLQYLLDEKWHVFQKLPKGIGVKTVELCIGLGFVRTKMVDIKRKGNLESYRTALHITARGKRAALRNQ